MPVRPCRATSPALAMRRSPIRHGRKNEMLALAVLRLHARTVPQFVPVDPELVRLISAWRYQRDIVDRTAVEAAGILTDKESKPSEEIIGKAIEVASEKMRGKDNDAGSGMRASASAEGEPRVELNGTVTGSPDKPRNQTGEN